MKHLFITLFCLLACGGLRAQTVPTDQLYGVGAWNADSLGNHRVVVSVDKKADAVLAKIEWRRRDQNPEAKNLIVVDAEPVSALLTYVVLALTERVAR